MTSIRALAFLREALERSRKSNDDYWEGCRLWGLAFASLRASDYQAAIAIWEADLKLMRERDILHDLGEALAAVGQAERAAECLVQAERLSRQLEEWNRFPDH